MLIFDLWGISFHAVVVFGLGKNILFKSVLGRFGWLLQCQEMPMTLDFLMIFHHDVIMTSFISTYADFCFDPGERIFLAKLG